MFAHAAPQRLTVAGAEIGLLRRGSGRPLVYLHAGDGVDGDDAFIDHLARDFEVIAPTHPGFGDSTLPAAWRSIDDLACFYLELLDHLNLSDCVLAGSSFGAWIAAEVAVRSTARIGALVLAGPMGLCLPERNAPGIVDLIGTPIAELPGLLFHNESIGQAAFGQLRFEDMSDEAVTRFVRNREALTLFGWSPVCANPVLGRWLGRIRVPTLLVWGDDDRVIPPAVRTGWSERLPAAQTRVIAAAGHYAHVEQPAAFAAALREFAAATSRRTPASA